MPVIKLITSIHAPIERCFDLSRSIDMHKLSTSHTKEQAIGGVTSGLIKLNETVTWRAVHFGISQSLTTKITAFKYPFYFVDEMTKGAFKGFRHEHHFIKKDSFTEMKDVFEYTSPFGIVGKLFDKVILKDYMHDLLSKRNQHIKEFAETNKWKQLLL